MTYRITIGQNQWLKAEGLGEAGGVALYQVVEAHRCPQGLLIINSGNTYVFDGFGF